MQLQQAQRMSSSEPQVRLVLSDNDLSSVRHWRMVVMLSLVALEEAITATTASSRSSRTSGSSSTSTAAEETGEACKCPITRATDFSKKCHRQSFTRIALNCWIANSCSRSICIKRARKRETRRRERRKKCSRVKLANGAAFFRPDMVYHRRALMLMLLLKTKPCVLPPEPRSSADKSASEFASAQKGLMEV